MDILNYFPIYILFFVIVVGFVFLLLDKNASGETKFFVLFWSFVFILIILFLFTFIGSMEGLELFFAFLIIGLIYNPIFWIIVLLFLIYFIVLKKEK